MGRVSCHGNRKHTAKCNDHPKEELGQANFALNPRLIPMQMDDWVNSWSEDSYLDPRVIPKSPPKGEHKPHLHNTQRMYGSVLLRHVCCPMPSSEKMTWLHFLIVHQNLNKRKWSCPSLLLCESLLWKLFPLICLLAANQGSCVWQPHMLHFLSTTLLYLRILTHKHVKYVNLVFIFWKYKAVNRRVFLWPKCGGKYKLPWAFFHFLSFYHVLLFSPFSLHLVTRPFQWQDFKGTDNSFCSWKPPHVINSEDSCLAFPTPTKFSTGQPPLIGRNWFSRKKLRKRRPSIFNNVKDVRL